MIGYLLPGLCGLYLGLALQWTGFHRQEGLRDALALRRSYALRSGLYAQGVATAMTALLCWLAVIDVDGIQVFPLSAGTLVGGLLFGVASGVCGFTPGTAFASLGGGKPLPALCVLAGCLVGTWLLPLLETPFAALREMAPRSDATLFRVTLDEPFLLDGGFLGQGCAGLLLAAIAICIPSPRMEESEALAVMSEETADEHADDAPEQEAAQAGEDAADTAELPETEEEETEADAFVAILPGEEPLVVDLAPDAEAEEAGEAEPSAPESDEGNTAGAENPDGDTENDTIHSDDAL